MHGTAIITRQTIEEVCETRNRALEAYATAYQKIEDADNAIRLAHSIADQAAPNGGEAGRFTYHLHETREKFQKAVQLPDRQFYLQTAKRLTDTAVWSRLIAMTGIEMLMDATAKEQLHQSFMEQPERRNRRGETLPATDEDGKGGMPEITPENVRATLQRFQEDAAMIFQRGLVNVFTKLDRRFRSHDGFKIGSRMILTYAFDEHGQWNYGRRSTQDHLVDIERTFAVLDGKPKGYAYGSIVEAVRMERRGRGWEAHQSVTEGEYFKVKAFKNGNAHLWFTRDDLLEKVNKILAEYYGEVIGDGMTKEADPFADVKTTPARYFGFYPTPDKAADEVMEKVPLYRRDGEAPLRILEPSAGTGQLANRCRKYGAIVDCVEIQPHLAETLATSGVVYNQDFLALAPETTGLYDVIVMNPPFDRERDIDHVIHAAKFLKPDGCLVAVMSAGTEFRETRKSVAFREFLASKNGQMFDMPLGSFAEVGTYVNTVVVKFFNDGKSFYR